MVVKDTITDGVNEGLIDSDKCGVNTLYWAFPSKAAKTVPFHFFLLLFPGFLLASR